MTYQYPFHNSVDFSWENEGIYTHLRFYPSAASFRWTYSGYASNETVSWQGIPDYSYLLNTQDEVFWNTQGLSYIPTPLSYPALEVVVHTTVLAKVELPGILGDSESIPAFVTYTTQFDIRIDIPSPLGIPEFQTVNQTSYLPPERSDVTFNFNSADSYTAPTRNIVVLQHGTPYVGSQTWVQIDTPLKSPSFDAKRFTKTWAEIPSVLATSAPAIDVTTTKYDVGYYPGKDFYFNENSFKTSSVFNFDDVSGSFVASSDDATESFQSLTEATYYARLTIPSPLDRFGVNAYVMSGSFEHLYTPDLLFKFYPDNYTPSEYFFFGYSEFSFYQNENPLSSDFYFGDFTFVTASLVLDDCRSKITLETSGAVRSIVVDAHTESVVTDIQLHFQATFLGDWASSTDDVVPSIQLNFINPVEGNLDSLTDDSILGASGVVPLRIDGTWDSLTADTSGIFTTVTISCDYVFPLVDSINFVWSNSPAYDNTNPNNSNLTWFGFCQADANVIDAYTDPVSSEFLASFSPAVFGDLSATLSSAISTISAYYAPPREGVWDSALSSIISNITLLTPIAIYGDWLSTLSNSTLSGSGIVPLRIEGQWVSVLANAAMTGFGHYQDPPLATINVTLDDVLSDIQLLRELAFTFDVVTEDVLAEFEGSNSSVVLSSTLEDAVSNIRVIHLFGTINVTLSGIIPYIRLYQLSFVLDATTADISSNILAKTPIPLDVTFDVVTENSLGEILLDYIMPILVQMDLITGDAIWRTLRPVSLTFGDSYTLQNLNYASVNNETSYVLKSKKVFSLGISEVVSIASKHLSSTSPDIFSSILSTVLNQAISQESFYSVNRLPVESSRLLDQIYSAISKVSTDVAVGDIYRILASLQVSVQSDSSYSLNTKIQLAKISQSLSSILRKDISHVNADAISKLEGFIDKELSFLNQSSLYAAKEIEYNFLETSSIDSLNEIEIEFLVSYSIVKEKEIEIEFIQIYDVHQAKQFDGFISMEYELNSSEQRHSILNFAHFGNARNLFSNDITVSYIADLVNQFESDHTLEHSLVLRAWDARFNIQQPLIAASLEHFSTYQIYQAFVKSEYFFNNLFYDVIATPAVVGVNQEYSAIYKTLENFIQTNYVRDYSDFVQGFPLSSNLDVFWDADSIYEMSYDLEAPTEGVMDANTGSAASLFRLLSELGLIFDVVLADVTPNINLRIIETVYATLNSTTNSVSTNIRGYTTLKLSIAATTPNVVSKFLIYSFIGSWNSTLAAASSNFRGFIEARAILDGKLAGDVVNPVVTVSANFRLTTVLSHAAVLNSTLSSVIPNITGIGHSVARLLVSGEPNSKYNVQRPGTTKIDYYWYELGVVFEGMFTHPYGVKIKASTANASAAFRLSIPEPRYLTLASTLDNVSRNFKGWIPSRGILRSTLSSVKITADIRFSIFKLALAVTTANSSGNFELFTVTRTFINFTLNPGNAAGLFLARTESVGKLQALTGSASSAIYGSHVTGRLAATTFVSARFELRFPTIFNIALVTESPQGDIRLKTPINVQGLFYHVTDSVKGGFKARAAIVGTLSARTDFVKPIFIFPSNVGEWHSYTQTQMEVNIYMVNRDAQVLILAANTGNATSRIKGFAPVQASVDIQLHNDYSIIWGKAPIQNPFKMILQTANVVPDIRMHNTKAFLIVIEKTLPSATGGFFLYHPIIGRINPVLPNITFDMQMVVPLRYFVDFTPRTAFALSAIQLMVPTYGIIDAKIGGDFANIRALTYYGKLNPKTANVSPDIRLFTITKTEGKLKITTANVSIRFIGKIDAAGRIVGQTANSAAEFVLHTPIIPKPVSGTISRTLANATSKIYLSNPTNGMRIASTTNLTSDIRLVSLVQGTMDLILKDDRVKEWEIFNGSKAGPLEATLESVKAVFKGGIKVTGFLTRTLSNIKLDLVLTNSPARTGNLVATTEKSKALFVVKSIQDQVAGVLNSTLDNIKFPYIYGRVPYRYFGVIESKTHNASYNSVMYVAPGGRLNTSTSDVFLILVFNFFHLRIVAETETVKAKFEVGTPGSTYGKLIRNLEPATLSMRLVTKITGHIMVVTAPPSLVRFRLNKELYGKMVPWDYIVGDLPLRYESELDIDPIYEGWRSIAHARDPRYCDLLKRTASPTVRIKLYTPEHFKARIDANLGTIVIVTKYGHDYSGPGVAFAAAGLVELWGRISPDPLSNAKAVIYMAIHIFKGTLSRKLDDVETDLTLRHARGFQIIYEFQTGSVKCLIGAVANNPAFMLAYTDSVQANLFATVPFLVYGDMKAKTGNVGMTRFIAQVREYKWAFWMSSAGSATGSITLKTGIATKSFNLITADVDSKFVGDIRFNLGTMRTRLSSAFAYITGHVESWSSGKCYILTSTSKATANFTLTTDLSIKMMTKTANATSNISLVVAIPKFVDLYFMPDNAMADFKGFLEVRIDLNSTTQNVATSFEMYYIPPRTMYVDIWTDDSTALGYGYITVYVTADLITASVIPNMDFRFMTYAKIESTLDSITIDSLIYVYNYSKERISDTYYDIEGDIIPDESSTTSDKKGYVRVYDGKTGELIGMEYTTDLSYKIPNLIEGEYTVVYDPDSQRRLKVHSKITLGD